VKSNYQTHDLRWLRTAINLVDALSPEARTSRGVPRRRSSVPGCGPGRARCTPRAQPVACAVRQARILGPGVARLHAGAGRVDAGAWLRRPLGNPEDIAACDALCRRVHGHHRHGEVADAVNQNGAPGGRARRQDQWNSTGLAFFGHTVGETNEDLNSLIGAASEFAGPGILVPLANSELVGWCLASGLRVVELMTLMTIGLYNEPAGSYLPSIHY
jgi:hypothetical protein